MVETLTIEAEVELDDVHAQMLEAIREAAAEESIESDIRAAAIDEQALNTAVYNGYIALQSDQR
jgi:hypothetical protein